MADRDTDKAELARFLIGRRISEVRFEEHPKEGFDLVFDDGSEVEFYWFSEDRGIGPDLRWALVTPEKARGR